MNRMSLVSVAKRVEWQSLAVSPTTLLHNRSGNKLQPLRHGICYRSPRLPKRTCRAVPSFAGGYGGQAAPVGCNRPPLPSPPPPDTPLGSGGLLPSHNDIMSNPAFILPATRKLVRKGR